MSGGSFIAVMLTVVFTVFDVPAPAASELASTVCHLIVRLPLVTAGSSLVLLNVTLCSTCR